MDPPGSIGFHWYMCTRLLLDVDFVDGDLTPACKIYSLEHLIERGLLMYSTPSSGAKISFDYKVREELQTEHKRNIR